MVQINKIYKVGSFFWVTKYKNYLGITRNFLHAHESKDGGSVEQGDTIKIRKHIKENVYIAELVKKKAHIPCGAQCAIGTLFIISAEEVLCWEQKLKEENEIECKIKDLISDLV